MMKKMTRWTYYWAVAAMVLGGSVSAAAQDAADTELKVGDTAPEFNLLGSDGKTYTLSQYKGKQPVVLAFFPKAFTPG